jgi:hypothetical protein
MKKLPLAAEQAIYILKIGRAYHGKCYICKKQIDCFNFSTDWLSGSVVDFDKINIICLSCKKKNWNTGKVTKNK